MFTRFRRRPQSRMRLPTCGRWKTGRRFFLRAPESKHQLRGDLRTVGGRTRLVDLAAELLRMTGHVGWPADSDARAPSLLEPLPAHEERVSGRADLAPRWRRDVAALGHGPWRGLPIDQRVQCARRGSRTGMHVSPP